MINKVAEDSEFVAAVRTGDRAVVMKPVYFIASYDLTDPLRYEHEYVPAVLRTLAEASGEVVVVTGSTRTIEGTAPCQTVVLRFPSEQAFRDWYEGSEYAPLLELRLATTTNGSAVLTNEFMAVASECQRLGPA